MKDLEAIFDEITAPEGNCESRSPHGIPCKKMGNHRGLHYGRSRFGGHGIQWSTLPSKARRKTRGASKRNRRAVAHRRADRLTRKTGTPHTVLTVKGKPTVAILVAR